MAGAGWSGTGSPWTGNRLPVQPRLGGVVIEEREAQPRDRRVDGLGKAGDEAARTTAERERRRADAERLVVVTVLVRVERVVHERPQHAPGRSLVFRGALRRVRNKDGKARRYQFHLFSDTLVYSKKTPLGFKFRCALPLDTLAAVPSCCQ